MDSPGACEALGEHQDPARFGELDNTLRIRLARKRESDEGIVQPAAKAVDVLSPRLHQLQPRLPAAGASLFARGVPPRKPRFSAFVRHCVAGEWRDCMGKLSPTDAAYFAGIVDGEGTITLARLHASENRRVVLSVSSTELRLLEHVLRSTAVGHITTKKTISWRHARSYAWSVRGRQALDLIAQIAPYLQTYKAQRARLLLTDYVRLTPRNGKYRPEQLEERRRFERQLLALTPRKR